ncbi:MAG: NfeD family protein [Planctomycetota bacterium]
MMTILYSLGLLLLFIVLLIGEFLVPSAGTVGIAAVLCGVAAIAVAFSHSMVAGGLMISAVAACTPMILYFMVQYWPYSPIGRIILNRRPGQVDELPESTIRSGEKRKDLVGKMGIAKTNLLPAGLVTIDGNRLDAVSDGSPIDAGSNVVVVSAVAGKLKVRLATESDLRPAETAVHRQTENIEASLESLDFGMDDEPISDETIPHDGPPS